jgi:hypothetical protein
MYPDAEKEILSRILDGRAVITREYTRVRSAKELQACERERIRLLKLHGDWTDEAAQAYDAFCRRLRC